MNDTSGTGVQPEQSAGEGSIDRRTRLRVVTAATVGNGLEYYDVGLYGFLAPVIAANFFPPGDPGVALIGTFSVFALSYLVRPIASVVFGHIGDRVGRKNVLAFCIVLMAASTGAIGLLPTYEQIGVLAPVLLIVARLGQGISAAGEWAGSTSFIVEFAPAGKRGLYGSLQQCGVAAGYLLAICVTYLVTTTMSDQSLTSWGWRVCFLSGLIVGAVGLYVRLRTSETPAFRRVEQQQAVERAPIVRLARTYRTTILLAMGTWVISFVGYQLQVAFLPSFVSGTLGWSLTEALAMSTCAVAVMLATIPFAGFLSDRIGRKPLLLASCAGQAVLAFPIFLLVTHGSVGTVVAGLLTLSILQGLFAGAMPASMSERFPTAVRYSALAVGFNLSFTVFGGTTPLVAAALVRGTGSNLSPAIYLTLAGVLSLCCALAVRENRRAALR